MRNLLMGLITALALPLLAQTHSWEAGFLLGGANYAGDLVQNNVMKLSETNFAFGLFFVRPFEYYPARAANNTFH